ncbi:DUF2829 domain-containing protein [Escherichia coli]|uniref:Thoeris anti-defense Tad2 family protein n=2 Tax=Escherichia coli TaxID=562 RepID=UPI0005CFA0B4|nr:MW1434 family type I TA system toxin [Escherichia coli]EGK3983571.1 DUF2829 domain-containing protein [Escherichia coli]EHH4427272.1 DUF2829 domain-containing protein [Escherichia coli]EJQ6040583.1 DUF2829 domain-containing protein [Salmonella enterica]KPO63681.1 hypothetical protein ACU79_02505 [Escherichia coli]
MNNMATKELFKFLPKYKAHKNVSASKIKNIKYIGGITPVMPNCGEIEVTEPKGVRIYVDAMFLQKHLPQVGGYLVVDEEGHLSCLSEKKFKDGFSRTNDIFENGVSLRIEGHNGVTFITARDVTISAGGITTQQEEIDLEAADFSVALTWLKEGRKVSRRGWKGEKQCCWLVLAGCVNFHDIQVPYGDHFVLKDAQNIDNVWLPSVADLLACDWFVVE